MEVGEKIRSRGSHVTTRWVPAHLGVESNEKADKCAKSAAQNELGYLEEYRGEASLSHLTRKAIEIKTQATREWVMEHVKSTRRYRPPGTKAFIERSSGAQESR